MFKSPLTRFSITINIETDGDEDDEHKESETPLGKEPLKPKHRMYKEPKQLIGEHGSVPKNIDL